MKPEYQVSVRGNVPEDIVERISAIHAKAISDQTASKAAGGGGAASCQMKLDGWDCQGQSRMDCRQGRLP